MRTVTLENKNKKRLFYGDIEFEELKTCKPSIINDLRFCLFEIKDKIYFNNAILIDIDNVPLNRFDGLIKNCEEVYGKYKMYHVFTGNGHHVYIPLQTPFTEKERPNYKTSYLNKLKILEKLLKTEIDKNCFNGPRYGRVPKSVNTKGGAILTYYIEENDLPVCEKVGDILKFRKVIPTVTTKRAKEQTESFDSPIYNNCGFIRHCHANSATLSHELWNKAMCGLSTANARSLAHEISKGYPKYDKAEVEKYFVQGKEYYVLCETISSMMGGMDNNPCHDCPHNLKGNSFSNITGKLPTPSASHGFYYTEKVKYDDGSEIYEPNFNKPNLHDIFNAYLNLNEGKLAVRGNSVYKYNGRVWEEIVSGMRGGKSKNLSIPERETLYTIPILPIQDEGKQEKFLKKFALTKEIPLIKGDDWDSEEIVGFENGVLDLNTGDFKEHEAGFYLTRLLDFSYDSEATCPIWERTLNNSIQDADDLLLFQVFAGLALSNVPTRLYKQYLWFYGLPDTGKSLFVHTLGQIVGEHGTTNFPPTMDFSKTEGKFRKQLQNSTLYVIDDFKFIRDAATEKRSWEAVSNVLVGGSKVTVRMLWKNEEEISPKGTLFVTSNDPPYASKLGSGGMERLRIIRTINPYPKSSLQSQQLAKELKEESAGIFNWALEGLRYFQEHGMPDYSEEELCEREEMTEKHEGELEHWLRQNLKKKQGETASMTAVKALWDKFHASQQGVMGRRTIKKTGIPEFVGAVALQFNLSKSGAFIKKDKDYILKGYRFELLGG